MNFKKTLKLFKKEKPDNTKVAQGETPNVNFDPHLLRYVENKWASVVKDDKGDVMLFGGKRLYSIDRLDEGLMMSRLLQINSITQQAKECGITKENLYANCTMIDNVKPNIEAMSYEQLKNFAHFACDMATGIKSGINLGFNDELVFRMSAVSYCFQDEDPRDVKQERFLEKVEIFRQSKLSFFFYTRGYNLLSTSLGILDVNTLNSLAKTHLNPVLEIKNLYALSTLKYLQSDLELKETSQYELCKNAVETLAHTTESLDLMRLSTTIGE